MQKPFAIPSHAMGLRWAWPLSAYLRGRLNSSEDRYMALYGKEEWTSSNMDLSIHVAPVLKDALTEHLLDRLDRLLQEDPETAHLYLEEADFTGDTVSFRTHDRMRAEDLLKPRNGIYFDTELPDRIRLVWNHMQTDGVGMWNALRLLFDPNPPLIPYKDVPAPPAALPELLALPSVAQRLMWRGRLRTGLPAGGDLTRGIVRWDAARVRSLRDTVKGPFNLVTSGLAVSEVFRRHQDRTHLTVGLTAYFPFLNGRNKYGVLLCKVKRGDLSDIVAQLTKQTRHQILNWGRSAAQSFALQQLPDRAFAQVVNYYRRQIDVLISNLPVGRRPITLGGISAVLSCHPWELTLPYYFLLIGTRQELHASFTSRFHQDSDFLNVAPIDMPDIATMPAAKARVAEVRAPAPA